MRYHIQCKGKNNNPAKLGKFFTKSLIQRKADREETPFFQPIGQSAHIQKQDPNPPANPQPQPLLTASEVQDAIAYNRRRYDEPNIRLIQRLVGAPETGVLNEETAQQIARFQDGHGLEVDGMAGPNTFDELTGELAAGQADDQTCLTRFSIDGPSSLNIQVAGVGIADIFSRFDVEAEFSPHCNCNEFDYRQYICGNVNRTRNGVVTNMNHVFVIPGGGLPQCPGWTQDGNTQDPNNGRYGHRNHRARANNRYVDEQGQTDMQNGCTFQSHDVPGLYAVPDNSGDQYDFDIRFFGDIRRNRQRQQRKFWAVRDTMVIP